MDNKGFTLRKRLAGFKYAFRGVRILLRDEHNVWLHCLAGICALVAGFFLDLSAPEWAAVVIVCGCVLAAEALNTAIERLADVVTPEYSEAIKNVKDLSAAGVLFMAIAAAVTGLIVFLPKLVNLFYHYPETLQP
ncbi:MAG: diacylglycerol kinase family protein [Tannerella sp.]|jgi:diacylglycerol kinase (ATP)|nr:diacylglycerol kinase family protein [Tannerella sp.]